MAVHSFRDVCRVCSCVFLYAGFTISALALGSPAAAQCVESTAPPDSWPESSAAEWMALTGPFGGFVTDPVDDASSQWDSVGGTGDPSEAAGFLAYSLESIYFRIRLVESPAGELADKWQSFAFHTLIESDDDTNDGSWDFQVVLDGIGKTVSIRENTTPEPEIGWCNDLPESEPYCYPATVDNAGPERFPGFALVAPACTSFGTGVPCDTAACKIDGDGDGIWDGDASCTDQFLMIQAPKSDFQSITGVVDLDLTPMVMGTGSNGSTVSKDLLGAECSDTWDAVAGQNFLLCGEDEYVFEGSCLSCPPGTTNEAGDDSTGPNTSCDAILIFQDGFESG